MLRYLLKPSWMLLWSLVMTGLLASCSLMRDSGRPTPVPIQIPAYEPGEPAIQDTAIATPGPNGLGQAQQPSVVQSSLQSLFPAAVAAGTYNGDVVAADRVTVVTEVGGMVLEVNADVGIAVRAGDLLMRVDSAALEAQSAQALAGLEAAQAQLELVLEEPAASDIEAARAAISAADAAYQRMLEGPTAEDQRMALAQIRQSEAVVSQAQSAYDQVKTAPNIGMLPQSLQLQQATLQLEAAQAQYDKTLIGSTQDIIAGAYAQLAQARAQLARLEEGAKSGQIRAAEAQVRQAETNLYLTQLQVDKANVRAPIDGVVTQVNISAGSMTAPGTPAIVLLSHNVEVVTYIEENRISQLQVGGGASIQVDAYPDRVFNGIVSAIAPELDPATRTIRVIVQPLEDARFLSPGMFARVNLQ